MGPALNLWMAGWHKAVIWMAVVLALWGCGEPRQQAPLVVPVMRAEPPVQTSAGQTAVPDPSLLTQATQRSSPNGGPRSRTATSRTVAQGEAGASRALPSDAVIKRNILQRFARSKAAADGFEVEVINGTAYLRGKTSVLQHKGAATRMARSAGALQVVNQIEVDAAAKRKAAELLRGSKSARPGEDTANNR